MAELHNCPDHKDFQAAFTKSGQEPTSFTPVRTEADLTGLLGAKAGTLTGGELAKSPWMARYPEWGKVGKSARLAPRGSLLGASRGSLSPLHVPSRVICDISSRRFR